MTDIRDEVAAALAEQFSPYVDADDVLTALAARGLTVVREGELDKERLADALYQVTHDPPWDGMTNREEAEAIARLYADLLLLALIKS